MQRLVRIFMELIGPRINLFIDVFVRRKMEGLSCRATVTEAEYNDDFNSLRFYSLVIDWPCLFERKSRFVFTSFFLIPVGL